MHRNHRSFLLFDIQELNQPMLERVVEVHASLHLHAFDVLLPKK